MPFRRFIDDPRSFARHDLKVMSAAFDSALSKLGLRDRADSLNELVAKRIVALAKQGERDPEALCERALSSLREGVAASETLPVGGLAHSSNSARV